MCNSFPQAITGACAWCDIPGVRVHSATKFIGAITHTEETSRHRTNFRTEFQGFPSVAAIAERPKAKKRKLREALESGRVVKRAKKQFEDGIISRTELNRIQKEEPFTDVDAFSTRFGNRFNKLKDTIIDHAHELLNGTKDALHLIGNVLNSSMAFTKARKDTEHGYGRFTQRVCTFYVYI